ncbi:winged helix-turn-helix transcriptional regulator [Streptomyces sp. TLI_146]|uniref:winged helix-turn-helix transcriptional regulator n=1 Tax=Streptomyces sp. TLI_146 TaxID=1938858 RepID=UPI000C7127C0|nr:winged helix-turn-helix transcriptional regulator [Streptomyces sp. TLI_146]PKV84284.1 HxlR family transcriptional regulator [Streptomyces sp. TLI_146]
MATTGLPRSTQVDVARVTESLEMIAPLWNVRILMTLSTQPLRYAEVKPRLPWLNDGTLHPKLRKLSDAGLVERTEVAQGHVTYGLTARGTDLIPVLTVIAAWGETYLETPLVKNKDTGKLEPLAQVAPAQNIEDALALISPRHATPILWALKERGASSAKALSAATMPSHRLSNIYPQVDRLVADGLVRKEDRAYELTITGHALAPVYRALSAWAAGRPLADADTHPLWGTVAVAQLATSGPWLTTQPRVPAPAPPAPAAAHPALSTEPAATPAAAWKGGDLFSHQIPARPITLPQAGGPRR